MKIKKSELKQLINEIVQQKLYEQAYQENKDFTRQICEFIKEKATTTKTSEKELANMTIKTIKNYFNI